MEINIDGKAIEDAVVKAIADSAIGEQIKKVICEQFTAKSNSWDSQTIMQKAISGEVQRIILIILREEIMAREEEIRALAKSELTDEVVRQMVGVAVSVMIEKING